MNFVECRDAADECVLALEGVGEGFRGGELGGSGCDGRGGRGVGGRWPIKSCDLELGVVEKFHYDCRADVSPWLTMVHVRC